MSLPNLKTTSPLLALSPYAFSGLNDYPRGIAAHWQGRRSSPLHSSAIAFQIDQETLQRARMRLRLHGLPARLFEEEIQPYISSLPVDPTDDEWHELLLDIATASNSLSEPVKRDLLSGTAELVLDWDGLYNLGRRGRENETWDSQRRELWHCLDRLVYAAWVSSQRSTDPLPPTSSPHLEDSHAVEGFESDDLSVRVTPPPQLERVESPLHFETGVECVPAFLVEDWRSEEFPSSSAQDSVLVPSSSLL